LWLPLESVDREVFERNLFAMLRRAATVAKFAPIPKKNYWCLFYHIIVKLIGEM